MTQNDLRQMVRDVLREVVAQRVPSAPAQAERESVRIATDADLMAFARRAIHAQAAVLAGTLRFTLAPAPSSAPSSAPSPAPSPALAAAPSSAAAPAPVVPGAALGGVVTEAIVNRHAGAGRLVLTADAVLTPLARDRARALNLKLERSR